MRTNPYTQLKNRFTAFANKVFGRRVVPMWNYRKETLPDLYERVSAAQQLGYEVRLVAKEDQIFVEYTQKLPDRPWDI